MIFSFFLNNINIYFFCEKSFEKDQDLLKLVNYIKEHFKNLASFIFKKAEFFSNISLENGNFMGIPSSFEILKVVTHYQFVNDQKLQVTLVYKTWLHILNILFCDQIQFSSIHFETPANMENFESKNTIYEEEDENENELPETLTTQSIKLLDEIEINNPIQINANKKRKHGVHDSQKERPKYYGKGVSFKEMPEDSPSRPRVISFDRSVTFESDINNEALDLEFVSGWIQSILTNLAEHMPLRQLKKLISKKDEIRFFNEDLLNDEEVISKLFFYY